MGLESEAVPGIWECIPRTTASFMEQWEGVAVALIYYINSGIIPLESRTSKIPTGMEKRARSIEML